MESSNWLVCSTCSTPIVERNELLTELYHPILKEAVYTYQLDLLGQDCPVYSATNPGTTRFDVVRATFAADRQLPVVQPRMLAAADIADFFRRLRVTMVVPDDQVEQVIDVEIDLADPSDEPSTEDGDFTVQCVGPITNEFTWFPPHSWNIATCPACHDHIGWAYYDTSMVDATDISTVKPVFFGFIVTKLREKYFS